MLNLIKAGTVKSRVLMSVTNLKTGCLSVLIYEMCFETRCGFIVLFGIRFGTFTCVKYIST